MVDKLIDTRKITPVNCRILNEALKAMKKNDMVNWIDHQVLNNLFLHLDLEDSLEPVALDDRQKANGQIELTTVKKTEPTCVIKVNNNLDEVRLAFKPYKFQVSLAELGCQGVNNIICVRTGSGKTLVAAIICKYWTQKLGKKFHAAFIVPTRHLANQQLCAFHMAGFQVYTV